MNKTTEALKLIKIELDGICETQGEYDDGWWETSTGAAFGKERLDNVLKIVSKALEIKEQESVAWMYQREDGAGTLNFDRNFALIDKGYKETPLYTHHAQPLTRDWIGTALERADKDEAFRKGLIGELAQPLSNDEIWDILFKIKGDSDGHMAHNFARAIEAKHGIGVKDE